MNTIEATTKNYGVAIEHRISEIYGTHRGAKTEAADACGVSQSTLANIYGAKRQIPSKHVQKVIEYVLGVRLVEDISPFFKNGNNVGCKFYTTAVPGQIVTDFNWDTLAKLCEEHRGETGKLVFLMNDERACEEHNCGAVMYFNGSVK